MKNLLGGIALTLAVSLLIWSDQGKPWAAGNGRLENLSYAQMEKLDRRHTVVLVTLGVLEEHGPHLPVSVDTIHAEAITRGVIEALRTERPNWSVVRFPLIPLGVRGTNVLGGKPKYMGSFTVRPAILRGLLADVGTMLAEQGFQNIYIIYAHGNPTHSLMVDEASEFVRQTTGAHMWNLTGLALADWRRPIDAAAETCLKPEQRKDLGMDIHGGLMETSIILHLAPQLVAPDYTTLEPVPAHTFSELLERGRAPDWPGYWSYPNWASAACGQIHVETRTKQVAEFALRAIDGEDLSALPIYPRAGMPPLDPATAAALDEVQRAARQYEHEREEKLRTWLETRKNARVGEKQDQ